MAGLKYPNLTVESKAGKLVITIDPSKSIGPSASGKSIVTASSRGNIDLSALAGCTGLKLGVNCYRLAESVD